MNLEYLIFKKYNIDPLEFESRYTVFDYSFFTNRLIEGIKEENKEKENTSEDKIIKMLRYMKYTLNKYDI